jgi:hypothetical protein
VFATFLSTLPPFTSLYFSRSFSPLFFASMVCLSPSMFVVWQHRTHLGLAMGSHRDCAAPVGSGGWQGGDEQCKYEGERITHTHVDDKMVWRGSTSWPLVPSL